MSATCPTCGTVQTVTNYCVTVDDYHATYVSDFTPTAVITGARSADGHE